MDNLRLSYELDRLDDIVEERLRLLDLLKIQPSNQDNVKLKKQLNRALDTLNEAVKEIHRSDSIETYSAKFNDILSKIPEGTIESSLYQFKIPVQSKQVEEDLNELPKKVRFKDEDSTLTYVEDDNNFASYRDEPNHDPTDAGETDSPDKQNLFGLASQKVNDPNIIAPGISNQDVFIQQQQQLLEQDSQLNVLSESIHRSHSISLNINQEVTEQNDHVLQDLESLVDYSGRNLDRAKRRLEIFEKSARENGPCFIIVALTLILILLIAIL